MPIHFPFYHSKYLCPIPGTIHGLLGVRGCHSLFLLCLLVLILSLGACGVVRREGSSAPASVSVAPHTPLVVLEKNPPPAVSLANSSAEETSKSVLHLPDIPFPDIPFTEEIKSSPVTPEAEITPPPSVESNTMKQEQARSIWARLRKGFKMDDLNTPLTKQKTRWYAEQKGYLTQTLENARPFLGYVVSEVERRGLPLELALLPLVESSYNPRALSHAEAAGLWQFIPETGKRYGLAQDWWRDQRQDIPAATRAALNYLEDLYAQFHNWNLALMAYNMGEGGIGRELERLNNLQKKSPQKKLSWMDMRLPRETREYVPKLQAWENIIQNPVAYGITLPDMPEHSQIAVIPWRADIDVDLLARLTRISPQELLFLNPAHKRPVIPGAGTGHIVVPSDKKDTLEQALQEYNNPIVTWRLYCAKEGDTVDSIAKSEGIAAEIIRKTNGIASHQQIGKKHCLLLPRDYSREATLSEDTADKNGTSLGDFYPLPYLNQYPVQKVFYRVRPGDQLTGIAKRFGVNVNDIKIWNSFLEQSEGLYVGSRLLIWRTIPPAKPSQKEGKTAMPQTPHLVVVPPLPVKPKQQRPK